MRSAATMSGTIAPGAYGDLIAVKGDPLRTSRYSSIVDAVIKGGQARERSGARSERPDRQHPDARHRASREPRASRVSKFVAAAITGSSAMLTEGVHSVVDSTNQLLLMWGRRPGQEAGRYTHPFGYGRELYFWSFVVAVLVFALGAGVSVYEGIIHIMHPEQAVSPIVAYGVLLVAFLLEGWSTLEAFKEFRTAKGDLGWFEAVRRSKDPPSFIVLLENGAAMAGIVAAAVGLFLSQLTARPFLRRRGIRRDRHHPRDHGAPPGLRIERTADRRGGRSGAGEEPPRSRLRQGRHRRGRLYPDGPFFARPGHGHDECRFPR